jgi:predicted NBD/HSP70 family sugar kinase
VDEVISLALAGDDIALGVLRKALDVILISVDICVKAYDPEGIFLDVWWMRRAPELFERFSGMVREHFAGVSYSHLTVEAPGVEHIETFGAAALLFDDFFTNKTTRNRLFRYCDEVLKRRGK